MKDTQQYTTKTSARKLEEELKRLENGPVENWIESSTLEFTIAGKKDSPVYDMGYIATDYARKHDNRNPDKDWLRSMLQDIIDTKKAYRTAVKETEKRLEKEGGCLLRVDDGSKVPVETQLLVRSNKFDSDLFQDFQCCGDNIVLLDNGHVYLCGNGLRDGEPVIEGKQFIKGNIAYNVKERFLSKFKKYWAIYSDFLQELDEYKEQHNGDSAILENWINSNIPTAMVKLLQLKVSTDSKTRKDSYYLRLKDTIKDFDDVFDFVLRNWHRFRFYITGQEKFLAWSNDRNITAANYWDLPTGHVACPENWKKWISSRLTPHLARRFVNYIGACMDASNKCQQYMLISDAGGTGKDFFARLLTNALPSGAVKALDSVHLSEKSEFGLSMSHVWESHISVIHELKNGGDITGPRAKAFFGQNYMTLNVKGCRGFDWTPVNHKTLAFSNVKITIKDFANRRRCIPVSFTGKLRWSEELEKDLSSTMRQFLDFCYNVSRTDKMWHNGNYLVLTEEDEKKFLSGQLDWSELSEEEENRLSKKAFHEDCLRDYFQTDDYSDSDIAIETYEPLVEEYFEITHDTKDVISTKDMIKFIAMYLKENPMYAQDFGCKVYSNEVVGLNPHNSEIWKFYSFLKEKFDIVKKKVRVGAYTTNAFLGIRVKSKLEDDNTTDTHTPTDNKFTRSTFIQAPDDIDWNNNKATDSGLDLSFYNDIERGDSLATNSLATNSLATNSQATATVCDYDDTGFFAEIERM